MAWVWAKMKGSTFFANFTIEKLTKVLICTPLCIARPLPKIYDRNKKRIFGQNYKSEFFDFLAMAIDF